MISVVCLCHLCVDWYPVLYLTMCCLWISCAIPTAFTASLAAGFLLVLGTNSRSVKFTKNYPNWRQYAIGTGMASFLISFVLDLRMGLRISL